MADPVTATLIASFGLQTIGIVGKAYTNYQWAKYGEKLSKQQAETARKTAKFKEERFRKKGERFKAIQRVKRAASGVTIEGSPMEVALDNAANIEIDALLVRRGGEMKARGFEEEAKLFKHRQRAAIFGGVTEFGSLLTQGAMAIGGGGGGGKTAGGFQRGMSAPAL